MANMFEKYAADREAEQKKIEKAVVADAAADEKRTTLSLSLTVSDKKALKMMAAERETTIAAIIRVLGVSGVTGAALRGGLQRLVDFLHVAALGVETNLALIELRGNP